ncbi:alpha/beta hydrolase [Bacillus sp. REN10]|uniref:alpha/beta hydrolase n=1 Tax=Bacillus sp. REN10 TaxID=2782541 RepID=UPI00193B07C2|nr:alpha/beta hydrolase [Bacillus sp. REN10]
MKIEKITYMSDGIACSGLLYIPSGEDTATYPAIVMAHGFSLVKEAYLPKYAEKFAEAGLVTLIIDYRNFGESEGENRQHMDPLEQIKDYRHAISWVSSHPNVQEDQIGIWGTSYSGGHVLQVGGLDRRVKAIVSQVPTIRGWIGMEKKMGKENMHAYIEKLIAYRKARYTGAPVEHIPVVSKDNQNCAQTHPEAYPWFTKMSKEVAPTWKNYITLESMEHYLEYFPAANMDIISPTPLMMIVATEDGITPPDAAIEVFHSKAKEPKKLVKLPKGHFDVYNGETFEAAQQAATSWFVEHLRKGVRK